MYRRVTRGQPFGPLGRRRGAGLGRRLAAAAGRFARLRARVAAGWLTEEDLVKPHEAEEGEEEDDSVDNPVDENEVEQDSQA